MQQYKNLQLFVKREISNIPRSFSRKKARKTFCFLTDKSKFKQLQWNQFHLLRRVLVNLDKWIELRKCWKTIQTDTTWSKIKFKVLNGLPEQCKCYEKNIFESSYFQIWECSLSNSVLQKAEFTTLIIERLPLNDRSCLQLH